MSAAGPNSEAVLQVSGLNFRYAAGDERLAVRNVDLAVNAGEIVCLLGASGCGKTTLLNLIAGLLQPESGTIKIQDSSGSKIGYIFQDDALLPWRTVQANLLLARDIRRDESIGDAKQRISEHLKAFHLDDSVLRRYPSQLSGGMRQRVAIIQSLMFNPQLLLLDEPFAALDFFTKLKLESEFHQLVKTKNKSAVLVTHDIDEAIAVADRVFVMNNQGAISNVFHIDVKDERWQPENARGLPQFTQYYQPIWQELQSVIAL
jgi:NitT/TauT family transport system ATP-binding protein